MLSEILALTMWVRAFIHETETRRGDERGAVELATIVIITAIIAAAAIAIATIIVTKFTGKANDIPTQ